MSTKVRGRFHLEELSGVAWHISSRSSSGSGNCVEAGPLQDGSGRVAVRNSRHRDGPVIVYTAEEWAALDALAEGS